MAKGLSRNNCIILLIFFAPCGVKTAKKYLDIPWQSFLTGNKKSGAI